MNEIISDRDFSRRNFLRLGGAAVALGTAGLAGGEISAAQDASELDESYIYYCPELVEITEPGPVVLPDGTSQCSWSRRPYLDLNFEDAKFWPVRYFQKYRLKKWDMYHMVTPEIAIQFLVAWIGYGEFCSVSLYDRGKKQWLDGMHLRLPGPGDNLMRSSTGGRTEYHGKKVSARFEVNGENRKLKLDFPGFADKGLHADITLFHPEGHDSICGTHLTNPRRAHYGHKINCMTAEGEVTLGEKRYSLDPEDSFGMLDFGRGYYPPRLFWYWAVASGRDADGKLFGWNLGHGNRPDESGENAVFHDGRMHKVGVTHCSCDNSDLYKPWRVRTDDGSLDLTMKPDRVKFNNLDLGFLYAVGRIAMGLYSGHVTLESGRVIEVKDQFGQFEWVDQKW